MHKCFNCGTEFESRFCPECGTEWKEKKTCPNCGATVGISMKFCGDCGYSFVKERDTQAEHKAEEPPAERGTEKKAAPSPLLHAILVYAPLALLALFAVLLPFLYIAPLAQASEMTGGDSINVYSLDEDFLGVSAAYLVFMCLALPAAAIAVYLCIRNSKSRKHYTVLGTFKASAWELVSLAAAPIIYLPCLIISAVAMADVAELDELMGGDGMISAGGAPKAVLSFAVISIVLAIGATIARSRYENTYPELRRYADDPTNITPLKKPLLYYAFLNAKLRMAVSMFYIFALIGSMILTYLMVNARLEFYLISPHWVIIGYSMFLVFVVILSMAPGSFNWSPEKFLRQVQKKDWHYSPKLGIKKVVLFAIPILAMTFLHISVSCKGELSPFNRGYIMSTIYVGVCAIVYIIAKKAVAIQSGYIAEYLYGVPGPLPGSPLIVEYDKERELELYKAYLDAKKQGVAYTDGEDGKKKTFLFRLMIFSACATFAVITAVSAVVTVKLTDRFSAAYVSSAIKCCKMPRMYISVDSFFGMPDARKELSGENKYDNEKYAIMYYDCDVQSLQSRRKYKCLTIIKGKNNAGDNLISVTLDTNATVAAPAKKKTAESVQLFDAEYGSGGYVSDRCYAEIFYTDGSYKYEPVSTSAFSPIDFTSKSDQTVEWSDGWGSYSATVKHV